MSKKEINMWDIKINFRVRKGSYGAETKKKLEESVLNGIGGNDMNSMEVEDIGVEIR